MNALHPFEEIERYAKMLDAEFRFPGTNFKFGIDPILNLIPGIGYYSTIITGGILILMARRKGASGKVVLMMFGNVMLDFFIGIIPIFGWVGDFFFKSNKRNVVLLRKHFVEGKHQGSGVGIILTIIFLLILITLLFIYLLLGMLSAIAEYIINLML